LTAAPVPVTPKISVTSQPKGGPRLSITAPWAKYVQPSVQFALVLDKDVDPASLAPLPLGGANLADSFQRQVDSLGKQIPGLAHQTVNTSMTSIAYGDDQNQKLLWLRGRNNSLGRPAVYAVDADPSTAIAIYLLSLWTDEKGVFRVELSDLDKAPKFSQAGRLQVWLLEREKVFYSEIVAWPGKPNPTPASPPLAGPSGQPPKLDPFATRPSDQGAAGGTKPVVPEAGQRAAEKPAPVGPKPPADGGKPVAEKTKTSPTIGPALPAQSGSPPATSAASAPTSPTPPATASRPVVPPQPSVPLAMKEMSVDQLADHIEKTWGGDMSPRVHGMWKRALYQYYQGQNPLSVRRDVLMITIRSCYEDRTSQAGLRNALRILYYKLQAESRKERQTPATSQ
jgi:hypothetical protein